MIYAGKEHVLFDEEEDKILSDMVNKYFVLKQRFQHKDFTRRVGERLIPLAAHDSNYVEKFKELYHITLNIEEMLALRDFAENDYADWQAARISEDRSHGMTDVDQAMQN